MTGTPLNLQLNLSDVQMEAMFSQALVASLTTDVRDHLIEQALKHLVTPVKNDYSSAPAISPIQEAFNRAVQRIASDMVEQMLRDDEGIRAKITELVTAACDRVFADRRDVMISRIADAIADGLTATKY